MSRYRVTWKLDRPLPDAETHANFLSIELALQFLAFTTMQWSGDLEWIKLEWLPAA